VARAVLDVVDTAFKFIHRSISAACDNPSICDQAIVYVTTRDYDGNIQRLGPISTALSNDPNSLECGYDGSAFTCTLTFMAPVDGYIDRVELTIRVLGNTVNIIEHAFTLNMPISKGMYYRIVLNLVRSGG